MSKGDTFENDLLKLIFNATTITGLARDDAAPITTITVALHTADPGESGTQATSEATYGSYARVTVPRTTGTPGWTASSAGSTSPTANIDFPQASSGTNTITHFSLGTGVANKLLYSGTVSPSISVTSGVTPRLTTASTVTED